MIRSKIIPAIVAAFCGLALQFQASGANAQGTTGTKYVGGTNVTWATAVYVVTQSNPLCSPYWHNCLIMDANGYIFLVDWRGGILWTAGNYSEYPNSGAVLDFQTDGNLVLYATDSDGNLLHCWRTGTTNWNGDPGYYMAVQDDGNFVIYDSSWSPVFSAMKDTNAGTYNGCDSQMM
jgi:hypothetical protein